MCTEQAWVTKEGAPPPPNSDKKKAGGDHTLNHIQAGTHSGWRVTDSG